MTADPFPPDSPEVDRKVRAIADDAWGELLKSDESATLGIASPLEQIQITLDDEPLKTLTQDSADKHASFARGILRRLETIHAGSLGEDARITHSVLLSRYRYLAFADRYYWTDFEIVPYKANRPIALMMDTLQANALTSFEQRDCYCALLQRLARFFAEQSTKLLGQAARGIRLPRAAIAATRSMYEVLTHSLEDSLLINPQREKNSGSNTKFSAEVETLVRMEVAPALQSLIDALGPDYVRHAPEAVGIGQYPEGSGQYRRLIEAYTTLNLDPADLHREGIERVNRIGEEIRERCCRIGLKGDLQAIFNALRTDRRFTATSPEQVGALYSADIAQITPILHQQFSQLPKAPYCAERLTPAAEKVLTYGGYFPPTSTRPRGVYYFNASNLETRTMLTHRALIYHELVPGHHLQLARQQENSALHPLRRRYAPAGFIEGWAEYAASLGYEMGLYTDPFDDLGRKIMELFLAMRLTVDTGLAEYGWTLEQARTYMHQHIFQSAAEIETESLRYAIGPGQALCYGVGYGLFWELRRAAERAAGTRFNVRRFHECALNAGSMPLGTLRWRIEHYFCGARQAEP